VRQSGNFYEAIESKAHDERMRALDRHFHPEIYGQNTDSTAPGSGFENCTAGGNA